MKVVNSAFLRAFIAVVAGALMISHREEMVKWLTISIGIMFFISGVISIIMYYVSKGNSEPSVVNPADMNALTVDSAPTVRPRRPMFPIVGLGSVILGAILCFMPTTFIKYVVYILAGIICLGAIGEYVSLFVTARNIHAYNAKVRNPSSMLHCGFAYWILPTLLLLFGIFAICKPMAIASAPFVFIGVAVIVYGVSEFINAIKFYKIRKAMIPEDAVVVEEVKE